MKNYTYYIVVLLFACCIAMLVRGWSPHDDFLFMESAHEGSWTGIFNHGNGRLFPLHGFIPFIFNFFADYNTAIFYIFFSVVFVASAFLLREILPEKLPIFISISLLTFMVSPVIVSSYFRFLQEEKYLILEILIISFVILKTKMNTGRLIIVLLVGTFMIFSKETGLVSMFFFALTLLVKAHQNQKSSTRSWEKIIAGFLLLGCIIDLFVWKIFIIPETKVWYGHRMESMIINFIKAVIDWGYKDPFIIILFIPVLFHRLIQVYRGDMINYYDCLAFAGLGYVTTFFITGVGYNKYYFAPVYMFAIPFLVHFLYVKGFFTEKKYKLLGIFCLLISFKNVPIGIHDIRYEKYNNRNYTAVIDTMNSIIDREYNVKDKKRINFFIAEGHEIQNNHLMFSTASFLYYIRGRNFSEFDLMVQEESENPTPPGFPVAVSFMDPRIVSKPQKGDYLLITPYCSKDFKIKADVCLIQRWYAPKGKYVFFDVRKMLKKFIVWFDSIQNVIKLQSSLFDINIETPRGEVAQYTLYQFI